jgi:hypothetical protein
MKPGFSLNPRDAGFRAAGDNPAVYRTTVICVVPDREKSGQRQGSRRPTANPVKSVRKGLVFRMDNLNYSWGMNTHGQSFGGAILPDMMRWLWRDGPVSTDPNDRVERSFRQPASGR